MRSGTELSQFLTVSVSILKCNNLLASQAALFSLQTNDLVYLMP